MSDVCKIIALDRGGTIGAFDLTDDELLRARNFADTDKTGSDRIANSGELFDVVLADCRPHNATDEQRYQFLEARSQRDAAEADRLAKKLQAEGRGLPVVCRDDREKMREVIEAMRPIVDMAIAWADVWTDNSDPNVAVKRLTVAVVQHRERVFAAMSAWADSHTLSEVKKLQRKVAAMEKVVEAACDVVDRNRNRPPGEWPVQGLLPSAVDAYRKELQ